jgi:DNA-3-methyladenine glycosylase
MARSRARRAALPRSFYARPAAELSPALIGTVLVHRTNDRLLRARIVETEAYIGTHDLAAHSSKGRTRRTEIMFGPAGYAYVYFIYGMHEMFNIVASGAGDGQAVLIRAAEPLNEWDANLSGPGRLARAMQITRADNGIDLTGDKLFLMHGDSSDPKPRIVRTARVGVDYAGEWKHALLRFYDANSPAVSKPRPADAQPL